MSSQNDITRLRNQFKIPDAVTIAVFEKINPLKSEIGKGESGFKIDKTDTRDKAIAVSSLNTPVYCNIEFGAGRYETDIKGVFKDFPELKFNTVLIQASRAKLIEETEVQGRDGKVKEYISMDDWVIQVSGIIDGKNGSYPAQEVNDLMKMLDAPIAIDVACTYLQNLGVTSIVVFDHHFPQEAGSYSEQAFEITFKSDIPIELRISNNV